MGSKPPVQYDAATFPILAAEKMAEGYTRKQLAQYFGIAQSTLYEWMKAHTEFAEAVKRAAAFIDRQVENSLFKRARGYEYDEIEMSGDGKKQRVKKTRKQVAPDVTACIFWLKNRQPERWRDRVPEPDGASQEQLAALVASNLEIAKAIYDQSEASEGVHRSDEPVEPVHGSDP